MPVLTRSAEPLAKMFADDGSVPNNPRLPFLIYRNAIDLTGNSNPAEVVEKIFASHRWGDMWRNGIFPYVHYHSMIHEALAVARGRAKVRFGGNAGEELDLIAGDAVVLPAGTGHQCLWASPELLVIGAYPKSPKGGTYNLCRGSKGEHAKALETIPAVPLPDTDPLHGKNGPLTRLWR
ncbi:MAG TPA: cupin domain-containing protein [Xanthobacteraceae bacterium]|nr:cupin domain-containing protein [Xanthobacteraceae bacterium]